MKYAFGLLIILLVYGCGAPLQYYRFQVRTIPYPKNTTNPSTLDSTLVLRALLTSPSGHPDSSDISPQDWNKLKNYAKEQQLILKTEKKKILLEKYEKLPGNSDEVDSKTKSNASDLKDMKLWGARPSNGSGRILFWVLFAIGLTTLLFYLLMVAAVNEAAKDAEELGCYIATVCYGDINASEVVALRRFRDQVMRKHLLSTMLVKFYYIISPSIASYLKGKDSINFCIRSLILNPIVFVVRRCT